MARLARPAGDDASDCRVPSGSTVLPMGMILQLPSCGLERVPDRNLQIIVIVAAVAVHHDGAAWQSQIDMHPILPPDMILPVHEIHHHTAGADARCEMLQFIGPLTHQGLGRRRSVHVAERNVQGE